MSVESDMRLAEKVLKDAGYDSWFAAGPLPSNPNSTRAIIRVRVGAENTQIAATTRGNVTKYLVSTLRDDGKSQTKNFEFSDYREAITYFYRQAQALRGGLSLKTRSYPHHGEGERLPLPNPAKMRASDLQVFADLKLELEELGIKTTEGMDGASFHLGAYLTDARGKGERLTVFRYVFPSTRARDGNRTQRTHPYAVVRVPQPYSSKSSSGPREFRTFEEASEHMLRVARAWKLGRKAALRLRPEDPDYRAPLPGGRSR